MYTQLILVSVLVILLAYLRLLKKRLARLPHGAASAAEIRRYREIFEHSADAIFVIDTLPAGEFRFEMLNPAAARIFAPDGANWAGCNLSAIAAPGATGLLHRLAEHLARAVATGASAQYHDSLDAGPTDPARTFAFDVFPISNDNGIDHLLCFVRDITERQENEQQLRESQGNLRQLLARCDKDRENTYQRIATEMHEDLGQVLATAKLCLHGIHTRLTAEMPTLAEGVDSAITLLDHSLRHLRELVSDLRPAILAHGHVAALEWLAAQFGEHHGIRCKLLADRKDRTHLGNELGTLVFRIAQDILENITSHTPPPPDIVLSWRSNRDGHCLGVSYAGDRNTVELDRTGSFGISGMKERVAALGGELRIFATREPGTLIEAWFPAAAAPR